MLEGYVSAEFCAKVTKNKVWKVGEGEPARSKL